MNSTLSRRVQSFLNKRLSERQTNSPRSLTKREPEPPNKIMLEQIEILDDPIQGVNMVIKVCLYGLKIRGIPHFVKI